MQIIARNGHNAVGLAWALAALLAASPAQAAAGGGARYMAVNGKVYSLSRQGLAIFCEDNPATCQRDSMRQISGDLDARWPWALGSAGVTLGAALIALPFAITCASRPCSTTAAGFEIGLSSLWLSSLAFALYEVVVMQHDLKAWRTEVHGRWPTSAEMDDFRRNNPRLY